MPTDEQILGREDMNDLEAILAVTNQDMDEAIHAVRSNYDTVFTWDYDKGARPKLNKLYEKAKTSQWNGETDLPWDTEVDVEKLVSEMLGGNNPMVERLRTLAKEPGSPIASWTDKEWIKLGVDVGVPGQVGLAVPL